MDYGVERKEDIKKGKTARQNNTLKKKLRMEPFSSTENEKERKSRTLHVAPSNGRLPMCRTKINEVQ